MTRPKRFVSLYGSQSGDWREVCKTRLDAAGVAWKDPTDPRWQGITHENGDAMQKLIDELVADQHQGLLDATCVVYHLAARVEYSNTRNIPNPDDTGSQVVALAARCELGFLTGRGIPTFVHIEPDVVGRNYLWAQMKPYPHMVRCDNLAEAAQKAVLYIRAQPDPQ